MNTITTLGLLSLIFVVFFTMRAFHDDTPTNGQQTRRQSIIEAWINILIGLTVNFFLNFLFLPLLGAQLTVFENVMLGCSYTAVSIVRQYTIRRWFAGRINRWAARASGALH